MTDAFSLMDMADELQERSHDSRANRKSARGQPELSYHSGLALKRRNGRPVRVHKLRTHRLEMALKRAIDIFVSSLVTLMLSPLLIGIAIAVGVSSPGGVLFVQEREGFLGRRFRIFKFRSLYAEATDLTGVDQVASHDHRVTPVGRILRRTSLDELPQLINILKGDMSLVGPRPHVPDMLAGGRRYDELVPYYDLRHFAKPGLTGWAQANGLRGPTNDPASAHARIDHDIAYIANFSFWLDIKILLITAWGEVRRFGRGV